eukprot:SAG22_NODE_110_length_19679_cov_45.046527_9_plen_108_part_00
MELFLRHGDFELPKRRALADYARRPGLPPPDEAGAAEAAEQAEFDGAAMSDDESDEDWAQADGDQLVLVQLPQGAQVVLPLGALQQLQEQVCGLRRRPGTPAPVPAI